MKTLVVSLLSMTVSVACLVYTWRSDASNKKCFNMMQEMSDKQVAMQLSVNGLIESSNYCLLHLEPVESKVPAIEGDVSDLQKGLKMALDASIRHQNRLDEIDKSINYLFENIPEKKK